MIKVLFIIRKLDTGGAQRQLLELIRHMDRRSFELHVLCFYPGGDLWQEARGIGGVHVDHLGKRSRWSLSTLSRVVSYVRRFRPHIVHGYMDTANVAAIFAKPFGAKVVWGIRASHVEMSHYDGLRRVANALESCLSPLTDLIICNSTASAAQLIQQGYPSARITVIPNGIDATRFRFDSAARERIREHWDIGADHFLIGLVARLDPMKGHRVFLEAAGRVAAERAQARFVIIGDGPETFRRELDAQVGQLGLRHKVIRAGPRNDIPGILSALDLSVSASLFGEGFSNTLAESMACGVPCLATDVGDSARILGDLGSLVRAGDPLELAQQMCAAIDEGCDPALRDRRRARIEVEFSPGKLAESTADALRALL
jgi:glycosyltransferase involved in cell wall biosynthesis